MCFPHPQSLGAALFVITTALLVAYCKALAPLMAAVTAIINPDFAPWTFLICVLYESVIKNVCVVPVAGEEE